MNNDSRGSRGNGALAKSLATNYNTTNTVGEQWQQNQRCHGKTLSNQGINNIMSSPPQSRENRNTTIMINFTIGNTDKILLTDDDLSWEDLLQYEPART
jgi:hypothetical protein